MQLRVWEIICSQHVDLQSQAIFADKTNYKKSLHILEDDASSVQVEILNT